MSTYLHLPLNMMKPYLDAAWRSGCPASRGDVNHAALFQRALYLCIHTSSPVVMASDVQAIEHTPLRASPLRASFDNLSVAQRSSELVDPAPINTSPSGSPTG